MGRSNIRDTASTEQTQTDQAVVQQAAAEQPAEQTTTVTDVSAAALVGADQQDTDATSVEATEQAQSQETTTTTQAPAPVVEVVKPAPVVKTVAVAPAGPVVQNTVIENADTDLESELARVLKEVPAAHQIEINRIKQYVLDMDPKRPIDGVKGAANQAAFYRMVQGIINRQEQYFTPLFTALLKIIKANSKDVFHEYNRHRFMEEVALSASDRQALLNLTSLLCLIADPKGRAVALRSIDVTKALQNGLTAQGVQRVMNYLNV